MRTCSERVYNYYLRPGSLGSDRSSDRHLNQLQVFLPLYAQLLRRLSEKVPTSRKASSLYHKDLVGRYVCRALNILSVRRTDLCTGEFVGLLYGLMADDQSLGMFTLRPGQVFNIALYKMGCPAFSAGLYRFTAGVASCFKRKR